jgi:hypothetical protein
MVHVNNEFACAYWFMYLFHGFVIDNNHKFSTILSVSSLSLAEIF